MTHSLRPDHFQSAFSTSTWIIVIFSQKIQIRSAFRNVFKAAADCTTDPAKGMIPGHIFDRQLDGQ
jgi:hypothetical protein